MKRTLCTLCLCLLAWLAASAQNQIDELVSHYSIIGNGSFTTVVKRNPKTRAVQMVVKTLTLSGQHTRSMLRAFTQEKNSGTWMERKEGDTTILTLVTYQSGKERIYTLRYSADNAYTGSKTTIIITMK